jgi:hypothetical protein
MRENNQHGHCSPIARKPHQKEARKTILMHNNFLEALT